MKDQDDNRELDALIQACFDGQLSEAEAERLSHWIEESSEARQRYWQLASVHGMVEQSLQSASLKAVIGEKPVAHVPAKSGGRWQAITSVAAGAAIGVLTASLVWAYTIPRVNLPRQEMKKIVFESFEDSDLKLSGRFPAIANQWFGGGRSVSEQDEMPAVNGNRVGQFNTSSKSKFTYARYLIDLDEHPESGENCVRSVDVEAYFLTSNSAEASVFQIRLGAFSQEPQEVRPIWNDHDLLFDTVLQHVGRNYVTEPGEQAGWHKLRATIEIPPGARSVVVSLGAGNMDPDATKSDHFVDAVRVRLVDTFESLEGKTK